MKKYQAFSLIELSIVILIIGILVAGVTQSSRLVNQFRLHNLKQLVVNSPVNSIKDLALWLETTQAESFIESEAVDGTLITQWFDINKLSTFRPTVTSTLGRATYRTNVINSLPAIYFNAGGWFDVNFSVTNNFAKTIFVVAMNQNNNQRNYIFDNATCTQYCFIIESNTNSAGHMHAGASHFQGTFQLRKPYVITLIYNAGNSFFRYNGVQNISGNTGSNPMSNNIRIGASCVGLSSPEAFIGHIGEFIVFDRVLKADEYLDIEKYLSTKWAIKF
ncbi:hypothetical protein LBMAG18_05200 [Alphaproteobacteria bacterium]|nr:hypothetical protein LBMAG18_05200 [Alphaproteobacteria bacterium]